MSRREEAIVHSVVVRVTQALFSAYEVRVEEQAAPTIDPSDDVPYAAVLGFTGKDMKGTLVLAPTRVLLARSHLGLPCEFRDWSGELANQLLGRIKNELLPYGIEIFASTPVTMRGHYLASIPRCEQSLRCFAASPGNVSVWFDAELSAGVSFGEPRGESVPREGDTILF